MSEELKQFVKAMSDFISDCGQWNAFKDYLLDNLELSSSDIDRLELKLDEFVN